MAQETSTHEADHPPLVFIYKNYRGEVSQRRVRPIGAPYFGVSEYHVGADGKPKPQWLMRAFDLEKNAEREFAIADISADVDRARIEVPITVLPWPKLLRDVRSGHAVRTKRALQNAHGIIAPGTIGKIGGTPHTWNSFWFYAEPCADCGYSPSVSKVRKDSLELIAIGEVE